MTVLCTLLVLERTSWTMDGDAEESSTPELEVRETPGSPPEGLQEEGTEGVELKGDDEPESEGLQVAKSCLNTGGSGPEVVALRMEVERLQRELKECQSELQKVQKQLSYSARLQKSTESYNQDLRQQVIQELQEHARLGVSL